MKQKKKKSHAVRIGAGIGAATAGGYTALGIQPGMSALKKLGIRPSIRYGMGAGAIGGKAVKGALIGGVAGYGIKKYSQHRRKKKAYVPVRHAP